jgi:hypothetical protein
MDFFRPRFVGSVKISSPGSEFLDRFDRRVQAGLFTGKPHWRARYGVTQRSDHELAFRARSFMTAINVGFNEVDLRILEDQRLEYVVTYRRWAAYALGLNVALGGLIGTALTIWFLLMPDLRSDIASQDGGTTVFWGSVAFWGFVWPWLLAALLIPMHKRFARQGLLHIIDQVDTQAARVSCVG